MSTSTADTIKDLAINLARETIALNKTHDVWPCEPAHRSYLLQRLAAGDRLYEALGRQVTGEEMDELRAWYAAATPTRDNLKRFIDGNPRVFMASRMDALPIGLFDDIATALGVEPDPLPEPGPLPPHFNPAPW